METDNFQIDVALERERRFKRLEDHINELDGCDGFDPTVPGVSAPRVVNGVCRKHPRYVLACLYDGGRTLLHLADTIEQVEEIAAGRVQDSELPVAYYDLDTLDGVLELPGEVTYQGEEWMVYDEECVSGSPSGKWVLKKKPNNWATVDPSEISNLSDYWSDDRLPVRYSVAKMITVVTFNTIPTNATEEN